jgi:Ca-activated chloride channel family protein
VLAPFIARREGDRLGLILFGDQPYLQTPLTFDRNMVAQMLIESEIGLAGERTALGAAVGLAIRKLRDLDDSQRVLVLLTDGRNTAGELAPKAALELAEQVGLRIYTIGVGADEAFIRTLFGTRRVNPSAELDEATLQAFAERTGGRYFRARSPQELEQIYMELDRLEPIEMDEQTYRPLQELYPWPLGLAVGLGLASGLLQILAAGFRLFYGGRGPRK